MDRFFTRARPGSRDRALVRTQVDLLTSSQAVSIRLNCLHAGTTAVLLISRSDLEFLGVWVAMILLVSAGRLALIKRMHAMVPSIGRLFLCLGAGLEGSVWAILPLEIHLASAQGAILMFMICALISGAAIQSAVCAPAVLSFIGPSLLAIVIKVFASSDLPAMFAVSVVCYTLFIVRAAYASEQKFSRSLRLRADAEAAAEGMAYIAAHDALTGLINRAEFYTRLDAWLTRSRDSDFTFALYFLDLDNFKIINDSLGHIVGDEVLCEVSKRLAAAVRPHDVVARLGGDEFAILLADDATRSPQTADDLLAAVCRPIAVAADQVPVGASLGIATAPHDGPAAKDLLVAADLALYAAKEAGRQCWRCFDETLRGKMAIRGDLERDLPAALEAGSIEVWFQPQVALHSGRLIGLEALLRWRHPRHGYVSPVEIVAAALRLRVSRQLTGVVLAKACAMVETMERRGHADVEISVNVSPREFDVYDVPGLIAEAIATAGISPRKLEIEITEEALIDGDKGVRHVARLADLGVRLAIDDFGAGNASIAYLRYLKVDRIKIDGSFIRDFADRAGDRVLVQAIIGIGRALGVEVVAEGVETPGDAVLLASLGCHLAQGFYFGRPMAEDKLSVWLDEHRHGHARSSRMALPSTGVGG